MPTPVATYRVQLHGGFTFDDAAAIAPYLADLGVTHLYCSPYLQAALGSTHGYDVVDHSRVNEELGGDAGHRRLQAALGAAGLGQVLDIVPNHMAIPGRENRWWWDVLENGPSSRFAAYFDVDWDPPEAKLRNTVLMPILGDHYGRVLESGDITLAREGAAFVVRYFDHELPVSPRSLDTVLRGAAERCGSIELASLADAFGNLPHAEATDREAVWVRHRDTDVLRGWLFRLMDERPTVWSAIDNEVAALNADVDALDGFLDRQNYRLAFWRTAGRELDYRRFFDITTLVGLRTEDTQVFDDTHELVLSFARDGVIDGLRIDHPDGLRDPLAYLRRLAAAAPDAWIVVEKILEPGEELPPSWPVAGTTGYDVANEALGVLVDPAGEAPLTALYVELTGEPVDWEELVHEKKHLVMREALGADVSRVTNTFVQLCEQHRRYRDYTRHELREAVREVVACFPVYRTYASSDDGVSGADRAVIEEGVAAAKARRDDLDPDLLDFLGDLLQLRHRGPVEDELVARFQQLTGPVMAKGVEDTAFYNFNRLVALNEVGGSPGRFAVGVDHLHGFCRRQAAAWPVGMTALSTHDTKRSEDVRARLAVLSEIPEQWGAFARKWVRLDAEVDPNAQYLLLQVLVGAHPLPVDRAAAYMEKAVKEAKARTSWTDPDPSYDAAVRSLVESLAEDEAFQADLDAFVDAILEPGRVNSLAQKLVQLTVPGVPDVYQGTELEDLSLVDPDNRRPVDYSIRRRLLGAAEEPPKLRVVREALHARRDRPDAFLSGGYEPLTAIGPKASHCVAFVRGGGVATVVPRLPVGLAGDWSTTILPLPTGGWRDRFTGATWTGDTALADLLGSFPVALLERE